MRITTITDLLAAVRRARPDAEAAGAEIRAEHVRTARHWLGVRYEDIDETALDEITEHAVAVALGDKD